MTIFSDCRIDGVKDHFALRRVPMRGRRDSHDDGYGRRLQRRALCRSGSADSEPLELTSPPPSLRIVKDLLPRPFTRRTRSLDCAFMLYREGH